MKNTTTLKPQQKRCELHKKRTLYGGGGGSKPFELKIGFKAFESR
jgi:hypothetical protein